MGQIGEQPMTHYSKSWTQALTEVRVYTEGSTEDTKGDKERQWETKRQRDGKQRDQEAKRPRDPKTRLTRDQEEKRHRRQACRKARWRIYIYIYIYIYI